MAFRKQAKEDARICTVEPIRKQSEIQAIIKYLLDRDLEKYALIFEVGCYTGLRAGDLVRLRVKDVYKQVKILLREQKTGKIRSIAMNPKIKTKLDDYIEKYNRLGHTYIFATKNDKPIDRSEVYKKLNEAAKALNINYNIGTHSMRKTFGYHHYKKFNDVALLQTIFNHASPDVTLIYIGITQEEIDKTMMALDLEEEPLDPSNYVEVASRGNNKTKIAAAKHFLSYYLDKTENRGFVHAWAMVFLDLLTNTHEYRY